MTAMQALVVRELKQHARWMILTAAVVGLACAWVCWRTRWNVAEAGFDVGAMLTVTCSGSAIWGFALGLLQTVGDARPDRWALLVHRPLARWRIVVAKLAAGAVLYALPLAIPFAATALWFASPAHAARPFVPGMTLPALVDLIGGAMCYAAAVLVGLRRGSRWPSRLLPIAAALVALAFADVLPRVGQALGAYLAMLVVLLVAAVGAGAADGDDDRLAVLPRLATALVMLVALTMGAVVLAAFVQADRQLGIPDATVYAVLDDGRVVLSRIDHGVSIDTDLDGSPIGRESHPRSIARSAWAWRHESFSGNFRWSGKRVVALAEDQRAIAWYVPARRRIEIHEIEGASPPRPTGAVVVITGDSPDGLQPIGEPGYVPVQPSIALRDGDRIVRFVDGALRRVATLAPGERTRGAGVAALADDRSSTVIATDRRVIVVDPSGTVALDAALSPAVVGHDRGQLTLLQGDRAVLLAMADDGSAIACDVASGRPSIERSFPQIVTGVRYPSAVGVPPVVLLASWLASGRPARLAAWWPRIDLPSAALLGAIAVAGVRWLALRHGRSALSTTGWIVAAIACGPVAILGWLALEPRTARERCAACGAARLVDREACDRCGAGRPAAPRDGSEIFVDGAAEPELATAAVGSG